MSGARLSFTSRQIGAIVGILVGLAALHTAITTPLVLQAIRPVLDREIEIHRTRDVHRESIRRAEFEALLDPVVQRLERIERKMDER